jgi:hypothetical protein
MRIWMMISRARSNKAQRGTANFTRHDWILVEDFHDAVMELAGGV